MKNMWSIQLKVTREQVVFVTAFLLCLFIIIASFFAKELFVFRVKEEKSVKIESSQTYKEFSVFPQVKYEGLFLESNLTKLRVLGASRDVKSVDVDIKFNVLAGVRTVDLYLNEENSGSQFTKRTIYNSFLENIDWDSFKDGDVTVWSRNKLEDNHTSVYATTTDAISHNAVTFAPDYIPRTKFVDYQPNTTKKDIYFPIRGSFMMYVYIGQNEQFDLSVKKRDLNLYQGEDTLAVIIKDTKQSIVGEFNLKDDGVISVSNIASSAQQLDMQTKLPEGIYSIEFRQNDSIVESFSTTISKFVFGNSLLTANSTLYLSDARPVILYTKKEDIFATLMHELKNQKIKFQGTERSITRGEGRITLKPDSNVSKAFTELEITTGDVLLESSGYFATSPESYFNPYPIRVFQFKDYTSTLPIDFVIARYEKPTKTKEGLYQTKVTLNKNSNLVSNTEVMIDVDKDNQDSGIIVNYVQISQ